MRYPAAVLLALVLAALSPVAATAAAPSLFLDINATGKGSNPRGMVATGGNVFFSASDPDHGRELWTTDGTPGGTTLVKDIRPGSKGSGAHGFTVVGGTIFFVASDGTHGIELWKTDGTPAGTRMVEDLEPGSQGSFVRGLVDVGGTLFFGGTLGGRTGTKSLFRSDGTAADTFAIKQVDYRGNGIKVNGKFMFRGRDSEHGFELWRSNGTRARTTLVKDINHRGADTTLDGRVVRNLTRYAGQAFFQTDDDVHGFELWRSDGTAAGTSMVKNINAPARERDEDLSAFRRCCPSGVGSRMVSAGGTLYFAADDGAHGFELWGTDGSRGGTALIADIRAGANSSSPIRLTNVAGTLYFLANDGDHGNELWTSDGTSDGTHLVRDINPGPAGVTSCTFSSDPGCASLPPFTEVGGIAYFAADNGSSGTELWRSDGTEDGTTLVQDSEAGPDGSAPSGLMDAGGTLMYSADDGPSGREPWTSDGTPEGTALLADIAPGTIGSDPSGLTDFGGALMFAAADGVQGRGLWSSDGTPAGTTLVKPIDAFAKGRPDELVVVGDRLFFSGEFGDWSLWTSDGTPGGTTVVKTFDDGPPFGLTAVGDALYFIVAGKLWTSDGSPAGTIQLGSVEPATGSLTSFEGAVFFVANVGTQWGLWKSDGTTPVLVKNLHDDPDGEGNFSVPCCPTPSGDSLFVPIADQLWKSDGTTSGTSVVKDVEVIYLADIGGTLYLNGRAPGSDDVDDFGLWKSDGTPAGTVELSEEPYPTGLTDFMGQAIFWSSFGGSQGLWISDGTPEGTVQIKDIRPGATALSRSPFLVVGSTAYFGASDSVSGTELWQTDGTPEGTTLLADISPGAGESAPSGLIDVGGAVYFTADDDTHGRELWSFTPSP